MFNKTSVAKTITFTSDQWQSSESYCSPYLIPESMCRLVLES